MSTKQSIAYQGGRFHLYHDMMDSFRSDIQASPVYLELSNCRFEAVATEGCTQVTVCIPADVAIELGLIRAPTDAASGDA